ncbi:MAG TPA: hypothetical protein VGU02_04220 [Gaiellaceae bacterium]|nr:hypothetical protein [Gaiellaceae bacterium]
MLDHLDDVDVTSSLTFIVEHTRDALANLRKTTTRGAKADRDQTDSE